MSDTDKERGKAAMDEVKGRAKDAWGSMTGDPKTEAEGKLDQAKGKVREGMADLKDKVDRDRDVQ